MFGGPVNLATHSSLPSIIEANNHCLIPGLPRSGKKVWKMIFFPGQGKVREFGFESGNLQKVQKVREKSGNFKIFSKMMVFGNILCITHCLNEFEKWNSFSLKSNGFQFLRIS